jgi:hypothetical protein
MGAVDPFGFDATSVSLANDARRYTQSTMSYVSLAGLVVAIDQLLSLGEARIEAHARSLAAMLASKASKHRRRSYALIRGCLAGSCLETLRKTTSQAAQTRSGRFIRPRMCLDESAFMAEGEEALGAVMPTRGYIICISSAKASWYGDLLLYMEQTLADIRDKIV